MRMKDMYMLYDRALQRGDNKQAAKTLDEAHKAQNALYDAIGGMEEYKFDRTAGEERFEYFTSATRPRPVLPV